MQAISIHSNYANSVYQFQQANKVEGTTAENTIEETKQQENEFEDSFNTSNTFKVLNNIASQFDIENISNNELNELANSLLNSEIITEKESNKLKETAKNIQEGNQENAVKLIQEDETYNQPLNKAYIQSTERIIEFLETMIEFRKISSTAA